LVERQTFAEGNYGGDVSRLLKRKVKIKDEWGERGGKCGAF
jgi:hypothetical protein